MIHHLYDALRLGDLYTSLCLWVIADVIHDMGEHFLNME